MTNRVLLACTVVVGLSLYSVYVLSTELFLQHLDVSSVDLLEWLIILTQIIRLGGLVTYFRSRPTRIEVLLVILSFETFVVMGLIVMFILSPQPFESALAHTIFSTWIAALFTILPPYLIFVGITQMRQNKGLTTVLIPVATEFGFLIFAAGSMLGYGGAFTFGNFFDFLIASAKNEISLGTVPAFTSFLILIPSVALYCGLIIYTTIPAVTAQISGKVTFILPLISAAVALVWVETGITISPNTLLSFTAPGIFVVVILWAYMRR